MITLRHALETTFQLEAVEASFLQAVEGIQVIENAYMSLMENVSHTRMTFTFSDEQSPDAIKDTESIQYGAVFYIRSTEEPYEWIATELDRPAIGSLSLLTLLYGANLDGEFTSDSQVFGISIDRDEAQQQVPSEYRTTLEDLLSRSDLAADGYFPKELTVQITLGSNPLYIAEMTYTNPDIPATFSLELHPTVRRPVAVPEVT